MDKESNIQAKIDYILKIQKDISNYCSNDKLLLERINSFSSNKEYLKQLDEELFQEYPLSKKTKQSGSVKFLQMTVVKMLLNNENIDENKIIDIQNNYVQNKNFFKKYFTDEKYNKILEKFMEDNNQKPFANWSKLENKLRRLLFNKSEFDKVNKYLAEIAKTTIKDFSSQDEINNKKYKFKPDGFLGHQGYGRNIPVITIFDKDLFKQTSAIQICMEFKNDSIDTYIQSGTAVNSKNKVKEKVINDKNYDNIISAIKEDKDKFIKYSNKLKGNSNIKGDIAMTNPEDNDNLALNQILYGPPGTGKTFKIQKMIEKYIYPQIDENNTTNEYDDLFDEYNLTWAQKLIFAFKINNKENKFLKDYDIAELPLIDRWYIKSNKYKDKESLICSIRGEMQKNSKRFDGKEYSGHKSDYFERTDDGFKLADDGKKVFEELCDQNEIDIKDYDDKSTKNKYEIAKEYYAFCTFHQSYSYEEFVEGIRPIIINNEEQEDSVYNTENKTKENIQFEYHDGIYKNMCTRARKEPNKKFFIFIDEINRGNISKIFGELITLIEPDKRENVTGDETREYHTIEVTLPYSNEPFTVPNNLYIIGTMNTADKSLALLDVALRRRFEFIPMYPQYENIANMHYGDFLKNLNEKIYAKKHSADYLIGHSYFIGDEAKNLANVLNKKVIPLLMEYFNGKKTEVVALLEDLIKDEGLEFKPYIYHLEVVDKKTSGNNS